MNKRGCGQWILGMFLLLVTAVASAVGMGRLHVLSFLGQTLNAEVDLVSVQKEELTTVTVRLASPEAFRQANLEYGAAAAGLRFRIDKRQNGELYIKITSARPINEPFVNLLIELTSVSGRLVREYAALIDPPDYVPAQSIVVAPAVVVETRPAPVFEPPVAVATPAPEKPAGGGNYGPVKRGETLFRIATIVKPEGVSMKQMLAAFLRSNPQAFIKNNINRLKAGTTLHIPDLAQLTAIVPEGKTAASKPIKASVKGKTSPGKPVLRLSRGEPPGRAGKKTRSESDQVQALEEELIARERALNDANQRIKQLEKVVKDVAK